jgi:hypothetical protein
MRHRRLESRKGVRTALVLLLIPLTACTTNGPPKSCRERVAYNLAKVYTNATDLVTAVDGVCQGVP